jgi:glucose-6-phosphate dehydrogenase assembly protein OpcA
MGVVAEIEQQLARLRQKQAGSSAPVMRTSTMTHVVWAPPGWLSQARATLAGLHDRHPARTIFLVPEPRRSHAITAAASLHAVQVDSVREAYAEVIEVRLGGRAIEHPASIVLPLLMTDLPVFCRWRGEPEWGSNQLDELTGVADRLVVDSSEWRDLPAPYERFATLFDRIAVSDIAFSRTLGWRARLAEAWPGLAEVEKLRVEGPKADALLLAGWLRSRLKRDVALSSRRADAVRAVRVDGRPIPEPIGELPSGSDLLSTELDVFGRDPVYEAAVRAASAGPTPRA